MASLGLDLGKRESEELEEEREELSGKRWNHKGPTGDTGLVAQASAVWHPNVGAELWIQLRP